MGMTQPTERSEYRRYAPRRISPGGMSLLAGAVAFVVVVLWGGYGHHWSWTGINGRVATLWDWLHLLLLPVVLGVLPIWLSRRSRLTRRHKTLGLAAGMAFGVLVLAGYMMPWAWTGFVGNRLWDWLELIALPLAVALTPILHELRTSWSRRDSLVALAGLVAFVAVVLGGYLADWSWTGFRGNTLWDWLHLLLLPLLLPTVVVPALLPMATAGVIVVAEDEATGANANADPAGAKANADPAGAKAKADPAGAKAKADLGDLDDGLAGAAPEEATR